jgi:hypothetical protein
LGNRRNNYPRQEEKIVEQGGGLSTTKTKIKIPINRSIIFEKVNER